MDRETKELIEKLGKVHNRLTETVMGLAAVIVALPEVAKIDPERLKLIATELAQTDANLSASRISAAAASFVAAAKQKHSPAVRKKRTSKGSD